MTTDRYPSGFSLQYSVEIAKGGRRALTIDPTNAPEPNIASRRLTAGPTARADAPSPLGLGLNEKIAPD